MADSFYAWVGVIFMSIFILLVTLSLSTAYMNGSGRAEYLMGCGIDLPWYKANGYPVYLVECNKEDK